MIPWDNTSKVLLPCWTKIAHAAIYFFQLIVQDPIRFISRKLRNVLLKLRFYSGFHDLFSTTFLQSSHLPLLFGSSPLACKHFDCPSPFTHIPFNILFTAPFRSKTSWMICLYLQSLLPLLFSTHSNQVYMSTALQRINTCQGHLHPA